MTNGGVKVHVLTVWRTRIDLRFGRLTVREAPGSLHIDQGASMNPHDDDVREADDSEEATDTGLTGGGGPASVIYGDGDDDEADEIAEEMLKGPDESS
jgi:hypothetical protein